MENTYVIEIDYQVGGGITLQHKHRFRVALADPASPPSIGEQPSNIMLATKDLAQGGTLEEQLDVGLDKYLDAFCGVFGDRMTVNSVVLAQYPFGLGASGIYVTAIDLSDVIADYQTVGTNPAGQGAESNALTATFFDSRGRVSKFVLLEHSYDESSQFAFSDVFAPVQTYSNRLIALDSIVRGSDNSFIIAPKLFSFGENEALFNKRNR